MSALQAMSPASLIALAIVCLFAVLILLAIWNLSRHHERLVVMNPNDDLKRFVPDKRERTRWFIGIALGMAAFAGYGLLIQKDENELRAERQRDMEVQLARLGCPAKSAGDTDLILLTIETSADLHTNKPYRASNCMRIVERGWIRSQPRPKLAAADK